MVSYQSLIQTNPIFGNNQAFEPLSHYETIATYQLLSFGGLLLFGLLIAPSSRAQQVISTTPVANTRNAPRNTAVSVTVNLPLTSLGKPKRIFGTSRR